MITMYYEQSQPQRETPQCGYFEGMVQPHLAPGEVISFTPYESIVSNHPAMGGFNAFPKEESLYAITPTGLFVTLDRISEGTNIALAKHHLPVALKKDRKGNTSLVMLTLSEVLGEEVNSRKPVEPDIRLNTVDISFGGKLTTNGEFYPLGTQVPKNVDTTRVGSSNIYSVLHAMEKEGLIENSAETRTIHLEGRYTAYIVQLIPESPMINAEVRPEYSKVVPKDADYSLCLVCNEEGSVTNIGGIIKPIPYLIRRKMMIQQRKRRTY